MAKTEFTTHWGWRRMHAQEQTFVRSHFGDAQAQWLAQQVRIGVRRLGDTRRALCLNGGWMSFPRQCFVQAQGAQPLRLSEPAMAGLFAHELLHLLQRRCGMPVTRQSAWLQCLYAVGRCNPYQYHASASARQQLRIFWNAHVEQQAQMWQDAVQQRVAGSMDARFLWVVRAVQAGQLQRKSRRVVNQ